MSTVIKIENLWKEYRLGVIGYRSLHRDLQSRWARLRGRPDPNAPLGAEISRESGKIWALKDINLEVKEGEILGIIGRNGAGKSTLLKVLSRVTAPTRGQIKIKGRIASLLEVGTGFHPELTGRENVFLNGAIMGMTIPEIKAKFDEIVDFSGVEQFIDTPVKRYSSGMYVRLAFAVAAHLEPEILIVDEVLAVGDAEFQKKCLGKMDQVAKGGRTVLLVSHNMSAIETLCNKAVLMNNGAVALHSSDVRGVVANYRKNDTITALSKWVNPDGRLYSNQWFTPLAFYIGDAAGRDITMPVANDTDVWIHFEFTLHKTNEALSLGYAIYSEEGSMLYWSYYTDGAEDLWPKLEPGFCRLKSRLPSRLLNEGAYKLEFIGGIHFAEWLLAPETGVPIINLSVQGCLSDSPYWVMKRPGLIAPVMDWF